MKLIDKKNGREVYDMENGYMLVKEDCPCIKRGFRLEIWIKKDDFLPDISDYVDSLSNSEATKEFDFHIQTTSYGSLPPEEIEKVIQGFRIALDTIEQIKRKFSSEKKGTKL